ncbi:aldehyde dehydrogenase family protein [Falsigemmobacter intermedius]|uniref:Aldehyde dehydrogenase family protein n=1 Tax=Falsigemmobacter intermedius TaxID=1553448 RepID=A0A444MAG0_9RHOB|nr:aldehyde dehydrogenase family protein [Falsigemmobacter intermedius]RWY40413.1 aldehyde dehydrogenase family protein [Falsigemmobacter intermedius]
MSTTPTNAYQGLDLQYIAGEWRPGSSDRTADNLNPFDGSVLGTIKLASRADVDAAYAAAKAAQVEWAARAPAEREAIIRRAVAIFDARADEIRGWLGRESGSTVIKSHIEHGAARTITEYSAAFPGKISGKLLACEPGMESRYYREALGVIGIISPWNFPLHLSVRSVAPALACGNGVVLKPASDTPFTGGTLVAKIFEEAGVPAGLLNVVIGSGSEIGDYFVEHEVPSFISFTGSTDVGKRVGQLATGGKFIKRVALELGGNAPLVVLDDADVDAAVGAATFGRFLHQGQICMSTNRVIVDAKIYDEFVEKLIARASKVTYGDPLNPATNVGPAISKGQRDGVVAKIEQAKADGARLVVSGPLEGNVIAPHIFVDVDPASALAREETFGPVLPVIKARDEAHALELANDTEYGLSSAVYTRDIQRGVNFARQIVAGMTHVNAITVGDHANAPFGGEKNSGLGRFNGEWIMEEFTRTHWITIHNEGPNFPF